MVTPKVIAIDFDGSCVTQAWPEVGHDIGAAPVLRELAAAGHRLILWTCRSDESLADAIDWFDQNEIPLFGVNENPEQDVWSRSPKAYAHITIDDTALGCPLRYDRKISERPFVDWEKAREWLIQTWTLQ